MEICQEHNIPYNSEEEILLYEAKHSNEKKEDDKQEVCVPLRVTIGVTVALCGLFLYFVPVPVCKAWAPDLMRYGIALAIEGTINRTEQNDDKKKQKHVTLNELDARDSLLFLA
jgi:hypothetical protein